MLTLMALSDPRWLLLIHQIPPRPGYLRAKIGRRLAGLGAVAVKSSVYVLPRSDQALEDLQWVRREIVAGRGDASVLEARFVEGLQDPAVEALFSAARESDYAALTREAKRLSKAVARLGKRPSEARQKAAAALERLRKRLAEVAAIDFFSAPGREPVEGVLAAIEAALRPPDEKPETPLPPPQMRGRTWVTRSGVQVDRIASAWLIRRFIDPEARVKLVGGHDYAPEPGELRFDMFEGEYTHEGDSCTFEVLLERFGLRETPLRRLAQIVHDIDLKDDRYGRPETAGLERLLTGIALRHPDDEARLRDGSAAFDSVYESFRRRAGTP
jgi:hypothetical protein